MPTFGTEPYKLHRSNSLPTSIEAAYAVDSTALEKLVYGEILDSGVRGLIADDLLMKHSSLPYSSITARFSALERKGFISRIGDKRIGRSGRGQMVMRASRYVDSKDA